MDVKTPPVEDSAVEWPEDVTPYRRATTLVVPPRDACDCPLSFAPGHALVTHPPRGRVVRAGLHVNGDKQRRGRG
ncbi:Catalase OS=Spirosoma linguale (strain ATCC 33905 / DSM 74 / LMG 10896) GN=Slin_3760 PE=4 SV=1 [Gemmataceae bacterium]|nr:Catalase OS=Spirosoma linguale (strain ATCC 33905 / DSM 74 / LMG 10896) GN=Slin_3760 PE=4 SV=1 [Gemmataceae bacterium]VTU00926.1 Catalase OS=Spirosoma linguale (strain ATCC 33905 / DSM 74 / LMG 10896) GN=Slin_3760 PE=4 SV=1 [Gemmataceae bacterium]